MTSAFIYLQRKGDKSDTSAFSVKLFPYYDTFEFKGLLNNAGKSGQNLKVTVPDVLALCFFPATHTDHLMNILFLKISLYSSLNISAVVWEN